jgi:hypothetical protein
LKEYTGTLAADQEETNVSFGGGKFELAEHYSDAMKVLFVLLFYSSTIMLQSLFFHAVALLARTKLTGLTGFFITVTDRR